MNSEVKILAVDDMPMNLEMLDVMLSELGIQLFKAGNGLILIQDNFQLT